MTDVSTQRPATKTPVTHQNAYMLYYDIESLTNVFTMCVYDPRHNQVIAFYLLDDQRILSQVRDPNTDFVNEAARRIRLANPAMPEDTKISFLDLSTPEGLEIMGQIFGVCDAPYPNNPNSSSSYPSRFRLVCDTDPGYDPINLHPYLAGYNSAQYDTTILALLQSDAMLPFHDPEGQPDNPRQKREWTVASARELRKDNDQMFSQEFKSYMPGYLVHGHRAQGQGYNSQVNRLRSAMISSGRYLDISLFNEKQSKVSLKRLLAMLGHQILESDKLDGERTRVNNLVEFVDLLAYNVSDVVGLHFLAMHPAYGPNFDLKKSLLDEYPETVYKQEPNTKKPKISQASVRRDRLCVDSSSAKFVAKILAPYANLNDMEYVDFHYPHPQIAQERGIERVDVLDYARNFFFENVTDPAARARFQEVYDYYNQFRGRNFNDSDPYKDQIMALYQEIARTNGPVESMEPAESRDFSHGDTTDSGETDPFEEALFEEIYGPDETDSFEEVYGTYEQSLDRNSNSSRANGPVDFNTFMQAHEALDKRHIPKKRLNLPYFYRDGSESSCFVTFSTGGIHGAELDIAAFQEDMQRHLELLSVHDEVKQTYPEPAEFRKAIDKATKTVTLPSGRVAKITEHMSNQTIKNAAYKDRSLLEAKAPALFKDKPDGGNAPNTQYVFTSAGESNHEDFTSYYPNMLRNMMAFYNPDLGIDRYAKILDDKAALQVAMQDPNLTAEERTVLKVKREGTKLVLNAASGAGDASHKTNIRMNNTIISMRIIGQLFSWIIGQAQTFEGARVVSTNTDGLYTVLESGLNNRILAEQSARINVEIEPEPLLLVSKDSNNRLEMIRKEDGSVKIIGASGSSLACQERPSPNYSLAHPAAIDYAVARYLKAAALQDEQPGRDHPVQLHEPFDRDLGLHYLTELTQSPEGSVHALLMFQNVIAASNGNISFPFGAEPACQQDPDAEPGTVVNPRVLQHQNRVFIVKDGTTQSLSLHSARAKKISKDTALRRKKNTEKAHRDNPIAVQILRANGAARGGGQGLSTVPDDCDIVLERISGIDPTWSMFVCNQDLHCLSEQERQGLLASLDLEKYLGLVESNFEKNWRNRSPQPELATSSALRTAQLG